MEQQPISDIAFTPAVKAVQERLGSRAIYGKMEQKGGWQKTVTPELAAFIAEQDTLFLGTVSSEGQPYIQHRGGPPGFLKVVDEHTLGFADYKGNQQYISMGNLDEGDRAFIFLLDAAHRRRIKIWGRARFVEDDPELMQQLSDPDYKAEVQRAFLFTVTAWDVNCPQHIKPRFTEEEIGEQVASLHERIRKLEAEVESCCPGEA
jgi:predicted pyridoxine 5'-phosphate oxidase superfamily flavin-nucleotide-binding protein